MLLLIPLLTRYICSNSLFRKFDCDGNRSISKTELKELISTVQFGDSKPNYKDVVKELFKDFDKDRNNEIDEPEFIEGVTRWLNRAVRVADTTDNTKSIEKFDEVCNLLFSVEMN